METIFVDKKGYEQMLKDIEDLKLKLKENSRVKGEAASGDAGNSTHDNFDFEQAKQQELMIISEIERSYERLRRVKIVEKTDDDEIIDLDDYVTIEVDFMGDIEELTICLIGGEVASLDYSDIRKISINSPMGKAVYKKKVGDITSYTVNENEFPVKILKKLTKEEVKSLIKVKSL